MDKWLVFRYEKENYWTDPKVMLLGFKESEEEAKEFAEAYSKDKSTVVFVLKGSVFGD